MSFLITLFVVVVVAAGVVFLTEAGSPTPPMLGLQAGCHLPTASSSSVSVCEVNAVSAESSSQHPHRHFGPPLGRV